MTEEKVSIWEKFKGEKDNLREVITIQIGEVEEDVEVVFREDLIDINKQLMEEVPERPTVTVPAKKGKMNIKVPVLDSDPEKLQMYKNFNDHEKAKKWEEKKDKIQRNLTYRVAYEVLAKEYKPDAENAKEGAKVIKESIRLADANKIVQAGYRLQGFEERLTEAKNES